ncbi:hypothetical protein AB0O91_24375 [Kitasatospora sp. NPDC089797]|uniref:hypothetical protein n=1 Tax=Kitasatospora sp. NPDC089797 TaxID=3155298 RepID=UPI00341D76A8
MTNWSQLSHAYGPADDIPALLERITAERKAELWSELWSALCHQGSVYPASFAALPWLARTAEGGDREQAVNALVLAGAITAGAGQLHGDGELCEAGQLRGAGELRGAGDVRAEYAAEIEALLRAVHRYRRTAADRADYVHLLEAMLGFEGVEGWSEDLAWGLGNEEFEVSCPDCEAGLFLVFGEAGHFSTSHDYALSEDVAGRPLRPADPAAMDGIGRRLHDLAVADGQPGVAHALTYVFGAATCPDCEADFPVADQVRADC